MSPGLVRLSSKISGETETNGLDHWIGRLKTNPLEQVVVVAYMDVAKVVRDFDKAEEYPVLQVAAIEVMGTAVDAPPQVVDAFMAAHDKRLGGRQQPLDFEDEDDEVTLVEAVQMMEDIESLGVMSPALDCVTRLALTEGMEIIDAEIVDDDQVDGKCWTCHGPVVATRDKNDDEYFYCAPCEEYWCITDLWFGDDEAGE